MSGDMNVTAANAANRLSQEATATAPQAAKPVVEGSDIKPVEAVPEAQAAIDTVAQAKASAEQLQASIEQLNEFMKQGQRSLAFSVDDSAEEVVVRVTDRETDELVRQIPSKEALELREHLDSLLGLLFSKRV